MLITHSRFLEIWALRRYGSDIRLNASVTRPPDSPDERLMALEMQQWYDHLLATAPLSLLETTDIAPDSAVAATSSPGIFRLNLNPFVRICSLTVETSAGIRDVRLVEPDSPIARLQNNPMTMAGPLSPVVILPRADEQTLLLYCRSQETPPKLLSAIVVERPPEGFYRITDRALARIPV